MDKKDIFVIVVTCFLVIGISAFVDMGLSQDNVAGNAINVKTGKVSGKSSVLAFMTGSNIKGVDKGLEFRTYEGRSTGHVVRMKMTKEGLTVNGELVADSITIDGQSLDDYILSVVSQSSSSSSSGSSSGGGGSISADQFSGMPPSSGGGGSISPDQFSGMPSSSGGGGSISPDQLSGMPPSSGGGQNPDDLSDMSPNNFGLSEQDYIFNWLSNLADYDGDGVPNRYEQENDYSSYNSWNSGNDDVNNNYIPDFVEYDYLVYKQNVLDEIENLIDSDGDLIPDKYDNQGLSEYDVWFNSLSDSNLNGIPDILEEEYLSSNNN